MLGKRMKIAREKICMSQEKLAEVVGMHTNTIARWERNEVMLRGNSLKKLAQELNVSATYLLDSDTDSSGIDHDIIRNASTLSTLQQERAKTKKTTNEAISPLYLSYTGKDGDKLEIPDTPKNRELFQSTPETDFRLKTLGSITK